MTDTFPGKFFEMPKGSKAAPPQQASLNELWTGKSKRTNVQGTAQDVDTRKSDIDVKNNGSEVPPEPPSSALPIIYLEI